MNKKYQIPTDKTYCCYSSSEKLEKVSCIPEELRINTTLEIKDYKKIIKTCNCYFKKKQITNLIFIIFPICMVLGIVLFVKNVVNSKYTSLFFIAPLIVIFIIYTIIITMITDNFDKKITKLNNKYSCKGIKIETVRYKGPNKNRRVTKIYIAYNQDWNRQPNPQYIEMNHQHYYNEIELSPIINNQSIPQYNNNIYNPPIPPPSAPYFSNNINTVSLEKNNIDNNEYNINNNNVNNNNNNINNNNTQNNYSNSENIPIDNFSNNK